MSRHSHDVPIAPIVLPATFIAGSLIIAVSHPYFTDGFGGLPESIFNTIEDKAGSLIGFLLFLMLFACTVTINGSRLLIACEILEHDRAFVRTMLGTKPAIWRLERGLRYMGFVCVESLILFAKFKAPVVYFALLGVHIVVVVWDAVAVFATYKSNASLEFRTALRQAAWQWLKIDSLVAGSLLVVAVATWLSMNAEKQVMVYLMVFSVAIFAFVSIYAWILDVADHWQFFKRRLFEVAIHSTLLFFVFACVLKACGWHFKALEHAMNVSS